MSNLKSWGLVLGALIASGGVTLAAQTPPPRAEGAFTVTAGLRTRAEAWNWFGTEDGGEYVYSGSIARLGVGQQWNAVGWQAELAAPVLLGLPEDAIASGPRGQLGLGPTYYVANDRESNVAGLFLKQAFLRVGSAPGRPGHGARAGRFEFFEGGEVAPTNPTLAAVKRERVGHRLLGNFGWSHVGRSLDGFHYAFTDPRWNVTAVAARPTQGVFNVDGWSGVDVGVGYGAVTLRDRPESLGEARLFVLHYLDFRDRGSVVKTDNRALAARQADLEDVVVTTVGGHYLGAVDNGAGTIDVLLWGAGQWGAWGDLDHRAWAFDAEIGYQPNGLPALRPWLRIGHYRGSGDPDATDGDHETFFQVLPTPRIYARLPFFNLMNLRDTFASVTVRPSSALSIRGDVRRLELDSGADLWYAGGGAFEAGSFGYGGRPAGGHDQLATLLDVSADYRFTPRLTGALFLGWASGGDVIDSIYPDANGATLGYLELEYRR